MISRNAMDDVSTRAIQQRHNLTTEEAVKHALVLPFIQALGYDVFDPTEVVPEFTADFGVKQGEKVDYAVMREGEPAILFECKRVSDTLDATRASQLARYFHTTKARIAVLTNGIVYKFFTDLDAENKMDSTPFLEFDVTKLDNRDLNALNYFCKHSFNTEEARAAASNLKYIRGMKAYLVEVFGQPDEDFVKLLARRVSPGPMFQWRLESFTGLVKLAFQGFVNDRINNTLQLASAMVNTSGDDSEPTSVGETGPGDEEPAESDSAAKNLVTTVEEVQGYELVKTILSDVVDPERIFMRDTRSYCGVLFDDNRRKPICRLHFNRSRKYLGLFDGERTESREEIDSVNDISDYAPKLRETVTRYLQEDSPDGQGVTTSSSF